MTSSESGYDNLRTTKTRKKPPQPPDRAGPGITIPPKTDLTAKFLRKKTKKKYKRGPALRRLPVCVTGAKKTNAQNHFQEKAREKTGQTQTGCLCYRPLFRHGGYIKNVTAQQTTRPNFRGKKRAAEKKTLERERSSSRLDRP